MPWLKILSVLVGGISAAIVLQRLLHSDNRHWLVVGSRHWGFWPDRVVFAACLLLTVIIVISAIVRSLRSQ
jgi:hypothetical protein